MSNTIGGVNSTTSAAMEMINSGNIYGALQLIMGEKSNLMTDQITQMVTQMDANNKKMKALTDASAQLTKLKNDFPSGASNTTAMSDTSNGAVMWRQGVNQDDVNKLKAASYDSIVAGTTGISTNGQTTIAPSIAAVKTLVDAGVIDKTQAQRILSGEENMGGIDAAITKIKSSTDSLSSDGNLQQIQLNRLISLRDTADQANSNYVKKESDTLSQIVNKIN